ncbi:LuxR family transcriptional regulator [uncultured Nocardioides sp.]|uniref:helix-turn-helix transcriptional regulator n=2 Tax=uncultured Nocardioides sp. TaxID=198441 RepID=UPI00260E4585|nr:LuxR family transcriptional regulator [uncultured Nocardioides sp.]
MPTFGRDEELQWLRTHALEGRAVLVTGAAGVGRTHLLGALAEQLARAGAPVGRISGGDGASAVPFAPFAPLVVEHLPHPAGQQVPDLEVFGRLPGRLVATGHVLVIDDLHLLDTASQILVAHLARAGLTLVASAPGRGTLPSALRDEVDGATGRRWSILALESLTDDSVLALAAEEAGDELAAPAGAFVVTHAEGNPRVATELVRGCEVRLTSYGAELGDLEVSPVLDELVDARLEQVGDEARRALDLLATAGRAPRDLGGSAAVDELAEAGLVEVDDTTVRPADLLVARVRRARLTPRARRAAARDVAEAMASRREWSHVECLMRQRAGLPVDAARRLQAAERAAAAHRPEDVVELLRPVVDEVVSPHVDLMLGSALSALEHTDEAEPLLERAAAGPEVPTRVRAGQELGLLHAVRRMDPAAAVVRVEKVADTVPDPEARLPLEVDLVKWRLMAGQPPAALPDVPDPSDHVARANSALLGAMVAALDGEPEVARREVAIGLLAAAATDAVPPHTGDLLRLSAYLADSFDGRLTDAERRAQALRRRAARTAHPSLGMWEYAVAEMSLHAGQFRRARVLASRAVRHLAWRDFTGLRPSATALLAAAVARQGRPSRAAALLEELPPDATADVKVALHVARVEAEQLARTGDATAGADRLAEVAMRAIAESHRHLGLLALDESLILSPGHPRAPARLEVLASAEDLTPVLHLLTERARALLARDADRLVSCAEQLLDLGLVGRAAHAFTAASDLLQESGRRDGSARAHRRAVLLMTETRGAAWPLPSPPPVLSAREFDVARLAASRLRSKEIAEQVGLSVRTVDNHLARVYRKLGIAGRDELAEALADLS